MTNSAIITSRRHALVEELRTIRDDPQSPFLFLEGPRLIQEALESGLKIDMLVSTPSADQEAVLKTAGAGCRRTFQVSEAVFKAVSDVETPQGILAVIHRPRWKWKDLFARTPAPLLILDGLQNPGNLSAIVRTAEAAGAAGLVTTPGTARLFSPKALRGAMGSSIRLPCLEHKEIGEVRTEIQKASYRLVAVTMASGDKETVRYSDYAWQGPAALLFGQEGKGLSPEWGPFIETRLHIPMRPPVESLNVSAAAAILLYEYVRRNA